MNTNFLFKFPIFRFCFLIVMLFTISCKDVTDKGVSEKEAKIKQCNIYKFEYRFGEKIEKKDTLFKSEIFDTNGNLIKMLAYASDNKLEDSVLYSYDKNNQEKEITCYDTDGKLKFRRVTEYDSLGRRTVYKYIEGDGTYKYTNLSEYDSLGNKKLLTWFYPDGSFKCKNIYKYNEKNQLITDTEFDDHLTKTYTWHYTYDLEGNISEKKQTYDTAISIIRTYKYDSNNRLISESGKTADGSITDKKEIFYNNSGHVTEEIYYDMAGKTNYILRYYYKFSE